MQMKRITLKFVILSGFHYMPNSVQLLILRYGGRLHRKNEVIIKYVIPNEYK